MRWPSFRKHPRSDLANICDPAESAARRLGVNGVLAAWAARRKRQLGSPAARKSWKMRWPSSRKHPRPDLANICDPAESAARRLGVNGVLAAWAARRKRQLGGPAARKSWKMQWPSSRKHPRPDLANICDPAFSALGRPGGNDSSTALVAKKVMGDTASLCVKASSQTKSPVGKTG